MENPRVHTGTGYQLRKNMVWKPFNSTESRNEPEECDLAQRWRFVCYTTGLCGMRETKKIVEFCKLWNALEFEKGVDCKDMRNRRNGSGCVLLGCLSEVARDFHGVTEMVRYVDDPDTSKRVEVDIEDATCFCDAGNAFQHKFEAMINQARRLLVSLNSQVRREVLVWFVGRQDVGNQLIGADGVLLSRDDISQVHEEYSLQFYPKKFQLCLCHGVR